MRRTSIILGEERTHRAKKKDAREVMLQMLGSLDFWNRGTKRVAR